MTTENFGISDEIVLNYISIEINFDKKTLTKEMQSDGRTTDQRNYVRTRIKELKKNGTYRKYVQKKLRGY